MHQARSSYIPQIDTLRAVAVLAVLVFHLDAEWLPGGFAGVDVFFVISGYVVSSSLIRSTAPTFGSFTLQFYSRRILRILPALLVCVIVTTILTALFIPNSWLSDSNYTTLGLALVGLSNFSLMFSGDSYFAPRTEFNPGTHTWSLGVEEQFYFVFPLIYFLWLRNRRRETPGLFGEWILAAVIAASFCYSAYASVNSQLFAYYSLPSRFWELGMGALLFQMHANGRFIASTPIRAVSCMVGSLLLLVLAFELSQAELFPVPWGILATAGSLLFIDAVVSSQGKDPRWLKPLAWRPLVGVGKISYSLYLWHWPIYVLFRWTVGLETTAARVIAVLLVFALSIASYRYVEVPIRHNPAFLRRPATLVVASGLAVAVLSVGLVLVINRQSTDISLSVTSATRDWYPGAWPLEATRERPCKVEFSANGRSGGSVVEFVRKGEACHDSSLRNLFVIGDSHATALTTMLSKAAAEDAARIHIYNKPNCGFLRILAANTSADCAAFGEMFTHDLMEKAQPGDIVFLPSLRMDRLARQFGNLPEQSRNSSRADVARGVQEAQRWLDSIEDRGLKVVFMAPTPVFASPPFRCSDWFNRENPVCAKGLDIDRAGTLERRQAVVDEMQRLATHNDNVSIWDPFDRLCPGSACTALRDGRPLFFDGDHLSGYGNLFLYEGFRQNVLEPSTQPVRSAHVQTRG